MRLCGSYLCKTMSVKKKKSYATEITYAENAVCIWREPEVYWKT